MDLQNIYLARQPIVDRNNDLVGFELLFRSTTSEAADVEDSVYATSTVITNAFAEIGLDQVLGDAIGFINVDTEFLASPLIEALPSNRIVLELFEHTIADDDTIARCKALQAQGYRIALDDFVGNFAELDALLDAVDYVKVDFKRLDPLLVPMIVQLLRKHAVRLVAQKVETPEQYEQAKSLGIELFQGFHFARPQLLQVKRAKPAKLALLRLLALAMNDAETHEIENEFKRHPTLSINLLRLVNSAAMSRRQNITSLRHALVLLGRRQLRVWLQLLLYTADRGNHGLGSPLLQLAASRGKLMELLAENQPGPDSAMKELAFITGILSLMDVLLEIPHASILEELKLPPPVRDALLARDGQIGQMLGLVEALERGDTTEVADAIRSVDWVDAADLVNLQAGAFQWANQLAATEGASA